MRNEWIQSIWFIWFRVVMGGIPFFAAVAKEYAARAAIPTWKDDVNSQGTQPVQTRQHSDVDTLRLKRIISDQNCGQAPNHSISCLNETTFCLCLWLYLSGASLFCELVSAGFLLHLTFLKEFCFQKEWPIVWQDHKEASRIFTFFFLTFLFGSL